MEAMQWRTETARRLRPSSVGLGCALLALIFVTAAWAKIGSMDELEATLIASRLVPVQFARLAAVTLLVVELATAVCLLIPRLRPSGLQMTALLLSLFIGYSAWRWWQNIPIPCHCFGTLFTVAPWQALLLNLGLLALTLSLLAHTDSRSRSVDRAT